MPAASTVQPAKLYRYFGHLSYQICGTENLYRKHKSLTAFTDGFSKENVRNVEMWWGLLSGASWKQRVESLVICKTPICSYDVAWCYWINWINDTYTCNFAPSNQQTFERVYWYGIRIIYEDTSQDQAIVVTYSAFCVACEVPHPRNFTYLMFTFWICQIHADVIKWTHFPRYSHFIRGIHLSPVNPPHKGS